MVLHSSSWTFAAASVALVGVLLAITAPRQPSVIAQAAMSVEAVEDAAAGVTFKIVPVDLMGSAIAWSPLTGDGSN